MRGKAVRLCGAAEQSIKEGKGEAKWTRLLCRSFGANAVRWQASPHGESIFMTFNPGDAGFLKRPPVNDTASQ
jgi:hypothetical protein